VLFGVKVGSICTKEMGKGWRKEGGEEPRVGGGDASEGWEGGDGVTKKAAGDKERPREDGPWVNGSRVAEGWGGCGGREDGLGCSDSH